MIKYPIPTGYLFVDDYSKGQLETLSIGDYGKKYNVKANFLGLTHPINGVQNRKCSPLSEKWVITLSTQFGCQMKCNFCACPQVKWAGNATFCDLNRQFLSALLLFPEIKYTERLNVHFARMGEPIFNGSVFGFARSLRRDKLIIQYSSGVRMEVIHPVLTTSMPRFSKLEERILEWCDIKNRTFNGQAGLQLSINSTNESQRQYMFGGKTITLKQVARIAEKLPPPISRKYCLNFAYASDFEIDAKKLGELFNKDNFMVKITPIHNNQICKDNNIETIDGYTSYSAYEGVENDLLKEGWDVLVFVPSMDEEDGLVTCGNAVLSGSEVKAESIINIEGVER